MLYPCVTRAGGARKKGDRAMLIALLIPLILAMLFCCGNLLRAAMAKRVAPGLETVAVGAVANFFDTLGIGSFAPTMAWFKFRKLVPDRMMPSTMLVGYTPPSIVQAIIFFILLGVFVDPLLLVGCVTMLVAGALLGAPLVARTNVRVVQFAVAAALLIAASFYALANLHLMPGGGTAISLPVPLMIAAILANFLFGVLLNFGVGNYAPTLAMLSLMGMDPRLSFPIMAAGASIAGTAASVQCIRLGTTDVKIATGLALGGIPAVLVAAFIVKGLSVELLRWLVIVVVIYAAMVMLRAALARRDAAIVGLERAEAL
jgi:uncharacterized membrane protein YfcA